jgi:hypothetical protein
MLWACPLGTEKEKKKLSRAAAWLKDGKNQAIIANALDFIPANSGGTSFNTVSWESQLAWLRSSFVWTSAEGKDL